MQKWGYVQDAGLARLSSFKPLWVLLDASWEDCNLSKGTLHRVGPVCVTAFTCVLTFHAAHRRHKGHPVRGLAG